MSKIKNPITKDNFFEWVISEGDSMDTRTLNIMFRKLCNDPSAKFIIASPNNDGIQGRESGPSAVIIDDLYDGRCLRSTLRLPL
jgi:hypothetical protein